MNDLNKKTQNDFTDEEVAQIIARAKQTSISGTAKYFGITKSRVSYLIYTRAGIKRLHDDKTLQTAKQPAVQELSVSKQTVKIKSENDIKEEIGSLKIENAVLREKIETLSLQLKKFSLAIGSLTSPDIKADEL